MEQGVVTWFSGAKGWGFIQREPGEDVFVHYRAIVGEGCRTLNEGDTVHFEVEQGPKGLDAANVSNVWRAPAASVPWRRHPGVVDRGFLLMAGGPTFGGVPGSV